MTHLMNLSGSIHKCNYYEYEVVMVATKSQMIFHIWLLKYENISKLTNDSSYVMTYESSDGIE